MTIALAGCSNPPHAWLRDSLGAFRDVLESAGYTLDTRMIERFDGHEQRTRSARIWRISPHARADLLNELYADDDRKALVDAASEITSLDIWEVPEIGHSRDTAPVTIG